MRSFAHPWIVVALAAGALGQSRFDVATIRPNADNDGRFAYRGLPGGTLVTVGTPLKMLIMEAYSVKAFQISGQPDWVNSERWDIEAKVEGVTGRLSSAQHAIMLRALLEDRFQLKIKRESRKMTVFALTIAKGGWKAAPSVSEPAIRSGNGLFSVKNGSIALLVTQLERELWRTVVDKTGLKGQYDYVLEWMPEPGQGGAASIGLPPQAESPLAVDPNRPSIFTALQEQLGLRLDEEQGPVEMIVIESVQKPSSN